MGAVLTHQNWIKYGITMVSYQMMPILTNISVSIVPENALIGVGLRHVCQLLIPILQRYSISLMIPNGRVNLRGQLLTISLMLEADGWAPVLPRGSCPDATR